MHFVKRLANYITYVPNTYDVFKSNLCLPRCFFAAFIFFVFPLLLLILSGIVMLLLEVTSTLQDHCLPQTTVIEPNFI